MDIASTLKLAVFFFFFFFFTFFPRSPDGYALGVRGFFRTCRHAEADSTNSDAGATEASGKTIV